MRASGGSRAGAVGDWLSARAAATPDAPAVVFRDEVLSYAELSRRAERLALALAAAGIERGDVVAALLGSGLAAPVLLWALHALGSVLLPLSGRLTRDELVHPLTDSDAVLLLHASDDEERSARAREVAAHVPGLRTASIDALGSIVSEASVAAPARPKDALLEGAMALLYTSGTTGRPKGAVLGAEAFRASAEGSARVIGAACDDRWLVCMPLFHVGGLSILIRSCLAGGAAIVQDGFDPVAVNRALDHEGVTMVSLVASMLERVLDGRGDRSAPERLRCVLLGGGPTPVPLLERAVALGWPVAPTYGLTEAASQVATRPPGDAAPPLDGRLRPLPGTRVRIVDAAGAEVAPGHVGEILVQGRTLMRGYLGLPGDTARALRGGWLHTGDVGALDVDGRLAVLDRRDDLIVSGGENVYPAEVEAVLLAHPAVAEAAVTGIADARFGARPVAFWVPVESAAPGPTAEVLASHCRATLAGFKVPVAFHRVADLPRGPSGKLLRRSLRSAPLRPDP